MGLGSMSNQAVSVSYCVQIFRLFAFLTLTLEINRSLHAALTALAGQIIEKLTNYFEQQSFHWIVNIDNFLLFLEAQQLADDCCIVVHQSRSSSNAVTSTSSSTPKPVLGVGSSSSGGHSSSQQPKKIIPVIDLEDF
jgi:hypothetical protein